MSRPRRINSKIIEDLRKDRDPANSDRLRTNMIIAAKIATGLNEKGWNKIRLATELKKSPSLVTRWLSGTHNFTVDTLREVQHVLGISLLNLEIPPAKVQAGAIVAQGSFINIRENAENYFPMSDEGEYRFPPLRIQSGIRIFSAPSFVPN